MGESKTTFATDMLTKVGTWIVIAMLGYTISNMQDRYTATTAKADREIIVQYILEAERRAKEGLNIHAVGGPHDDVGGRLVRVETALETRLDALTTEVRMLRQDMNNLLSNGNTK